MKKVKLSREEMREFAEVFADYNYGDKEIGMVPLYPDYPDKTRLINYLTAIIQTANEYGGVYSTSDKKEGIIILTDTTHPYPGTAMVKMIWRMVVIDLTLHGLAIVAEMVCQVFSILNCKQASGQIVKILANANT